MLEQGLNGLLSIFVCLTASFIAGSSMLLCCLFYFLNRAEALLITTMASDDENNDENVEEDEVWSRDWIQRCILFDL